MTRLLSRPARRALLAALLALPIVADLAFHASAAHAGTHSTTSNPCFGASPRTGV
ncbi:hypothetical protein LJ656_04180 [Paraburkholderia sp. MMS20-SJTR3]|uniref:Uncharacterized protein n=1 Tax=Paraburkholderia sejongensis TaxID=2886946 RepID=A0ABS8JPI5_9BURK|nr:hypothetical protein [Paraburkholderia sp. MMS20-SJTR3]MCC8391777.1 hypothetical protein [Paraburkholderia sp. MMS20-SJTR3]